VEASREDATRPADAGSLAPGLDPGVARDDGIGAPPNLGLQTPLQETQKTAATNSPEAGLAGGPDGQADGKANPEEELAADGSLRAVLDPGVALDDGPADSTRDDGLPSGVCDDSAAPAQNAGAQTAPQNSENMGSAPGNGAGAGSSEEGCEPTDGLASRGEAPEGAREADSANRIPDAPDPFELAPIITVRTPTDSVGGFRLVRVRMVRNGWVACG
jgi:hypothetical protein